MTLLEQIRSKAKAAGKTIVLAEGTEERTLKAADIILSEGSKGYVNPHKNVICNWNEDRDYLYPIPTDERQLNNNLTQNPGW